MTANSNGSVMVDKDDFARLEDKVDNLASALGKLILFDDRQMRQGERIGTLETNLEVAIKALDTKIDTKVKELNEKHSSLHDTVMKCINYGLGAFGTISGLLALYKTIH
jgi:hypothetical protein